MYRFMSKEEIEIEQISDLKMLHLYQLGGSDALAVCYGNDKQINLCAMDTNYTLLMERALTLYSQCEDKDSIIIDENTKYELLQRLQGMKNHQKLCHGDYHPSNVIVKDDGTIYVIDWAHVTQGNASADAARTYLLYCLEGKEEIAEKYLDLFCSKSGISKKNVQMWMPIVAASQSVKGNENERQFLLSWVTVCDYQ